MVSVMRRLLPLIERENTVINRSGIFSASISRRLGKLSVRRKKKAWPMRDQTYFPSVLDPCLYVPSCNTLLTSCSDSHIPCWRMPWMAISKSTSAPSRRAANKMPREPVTLSPHSRAVRRAAWSSRQTVGIDSARASAMTEASPRSVALDRKGGMEVGEDR